MQKIFVISYRTMNSFFTIKSPSDGLFKDKGSRFISFAFPVSSAEEAMEIVKQKRKEFFDARHVCYAYMIGSMHDEFRANDDGEPSSTAGKPILGQLVSNDITNTLICVIRYFGGVKLGTSGLIVAYREAAADGIAHSKIEEKFVEHIVRYIFSYPMMNDVMKIVKEMNANIVEQNFDNTCEIVLSIRQSLAEQLETRLNKLSFE